ncbi:WD40-repeat-containing domain protein [Blastocladiella britannica]|nr:WD40-repeat-containing domain protein [Blastocladiella britannica]
MATLLSIPAPVSAFAFNANRSQVALCPNTTEVHIYTLQGDQSYAHTHTLAKHDQLVTGIDWAHRSNRIVTCSQDRNGYVWTFDAATNVWQPELVMLRINRSATAVRWSPNEDKFAVASGAKQVSVCYFDSDNQWWSCKHIKKDIRSTVLALDWHPNSVLLALAGADRRARVVSAFIKGLDAKPAPSPWGEKLPFGTVCADVLAEGAGWLHGISFSPSGEEIAFVGHDSSLSVYAPATATLATVRIPILPLTSLTWLSASSIVGAGHDCTPVLFTMRSTGWTYAGKIDEGKRSTAAAAGNSALAKFKAMDTRATTAANDTEQMTIHQNSITQICLLNANEYATGGVDGRIVVWSALDEAIQRLSIA